MRAHMWTCAKTRRLSKDVSCFERQGKSPSAPKATKPKFLNRFPPTYPWCQTGSVCPAFSLAELTMRVGSSRIIDFLGFFGQSTQEVSLGACRLANRKRRDARCWPRHALEHKPKEFHQKPTAKRFEHVLEHGWTWQMVMNTANEMMRACFILSRSLDPYLSLSFSLFLSLSLSFSLFLFSLFLSLSLSLALSFSLSLSWGQFPGGERRSRGQVQICQGCEFSKDTFFVFLEYVMVISKVR